MKSLVATKQDAKKLSEGIAKLEQAVSDAKALGNTRKVKVLSLVLSRLLRDKARR